ncbi:MAG: hypothetical protein JXA30_05410 [Deltaproteobacteria bacterium]|nr:hypothetical protein [Deltaproteobacteria bacterium]
MTYSLQFNPREYEEFSSFIKERTGILLARDKKDEYQRRLSVTSLIPGTDSARDFLRNIKRSTEALQKLVNQLTVGESYFFRNRPHFDALQRRIIPELVENAKHIRKLRIWSAGCAKGEEAYSMAILLHEYFPMIRDWDVLIYASDINTSFLELAKQAVYSKWSLRGLDRKLLDPYFIKRSDELYELDPSIKSRVVFARHNLNDLEPGTALTGEPWDLVLCRNVLIYLSHDAVQKAVQYIEAVLRPGGFLLTGHSEALACSSELQLVYSDSTFYYRRRVGEAKIKGAIRPERHRFSIPAYEVRSIFPKASTGEVKRMSLAPLPLFSDNRPARPSFYSIHSKAGQSEAIFEQTQGHIDRGEIERAYEILDRFIKSNPIDHRIYFLHAVVADQLGRSVAALQSLKQAIFLNNKFIIGHYYIATIREREGEYQKAKKHFRNVLRLLQGINESSQIEDAEGLTVRRLREITEARLKELSL